jgi:hypothetical protein
MLPLVLLLGLFLTWVTQGNCYQAVGSRRAAPLVVRVKMVQSINVPGILALGRLLRRPSLLVPHLAVQDINALDFKALKQAGRYSDIFGS